MFGGVTPVKLSVALAGIESNSFPIDEPLQDGVENYYGTYSEMIGTGPDHRKQPVF